MRIYRRSTLRAAAAARPGSSRPGSHHAHGLHSPYWWLRCLVGPTNDAHPAVAAYHQVLVWDIVKAPAGHSCRRSRPEPVDRQEPRALPDQVRTQYVPGSPMPSPRRLAACRDGVAHDSEQGAAA